MAKKIAKIDIIGTIYDWGENSAQWFREQLNEYKDADEFEFLVVSDGGSVPAGLAIYEMIKAIDKPTTTRISFAASTAGWAFMASNKVVMAKNALLMLHLPQIDPGYVSEETLPEVSNLLIKIKQVIIDTFTRKGKISETDLLNYMSNDAGTWFDGKEALENGFIDELDEPIEIEDREKDLRIAGHFINKGRFNGIPAIDKQVFVLSEIRNEINSYKTTLKEYFDE